MYSSAKRYVAAAASSRNYSRRQPASSISGSPASAAPAAGDRALSLDVAKAEAHPQALAVARPGRLERAGMLMQAAEAAGQAGPYAEAETLLQEAVAGFREQGDRRHTGQALARLAPGP